VYLGQMESAGTVKRRKTTQGKVSYWGLK